MNIEPLAKAFTKLLQDNKGREAAEKYWADDVISLENMPGDRAKLQGKDAVFKKHDWWENTFEMHGGSVEGPYVHGNQFAVYFTLDATNNDTGERSTMKEVGLYTVKNDKIVEERFFYTNEDN